MLPELPPAFDHIKHSQVASLGSADKEMEDNHGKEGDGEAKYTFPSDDLDRADCITLQEVFFDDELRGSEDLSSRNHNNSEDDTSSRADTLVAFLAVWLDRRDLLVGLNGTCQPDDCHAEHDSEKREPLEQVQLPAEEGHAKEPDE